MAGASGRSSGSGRRETSGGARRRAAGRRSTPPRAAWRRRLLPDLDGIALLLDAARQATGGLPVREGGRGGPVAPALREAPPRGSARAWWSARRPEAVGRFGGAARTRLGRGDDGRSRLHRRQRSAGPLDGRSSTLGASRTSHASRRRRPSLGGSAGLGRGRVDRARRDEQGREASRRAAAACPSRRPVRHERGGRWRRRARREATAAHHVAQTEEDGQERGDESGGGDQGPGHDRQEPEAPRLVPSAVVRVVGLVPLDPVLGEDILLREEIGRVEQTVRPGSCPGSRTGARASSVGSITLGRIGKRRATSLTGRETSLVDANTCA